MNAILILILFCSISSFGQTWDFPVKPGSKEWKTFATGQEMVKACQIPESILKKISTRALVEICLNYPLFFEYTSCNNERIGIDEIIKNFNGLYESTLRNDGVKELINLYREMPVDTIPFLRTKAKDISYKLMYMELLLSNNRFIKKAKKIDFENMKSAFLDKYERKLKKRNIYSIILPKWFNCFGIYE